MTLNAPTLTAFQQCPRKYLLNESSEIRRWRPKSLFTHCLRQAIYGFSQSFKLEYVTAEAVAKFMETAANPGLDTESDPFTVARSLCSCLKTVLARVHACKVPSLRVMPGIILSESVKWCCNALFDGNQLHQWAVVDHLNNSVLTRELHSWKVIGDCAASGLSMILHVVEIGRQSANGHYNSAWCRTFAHPIVINRWAFQQKDGKPLQGKWKPIYFEDGRNDPQTWIELMERDNVRLLKDVPVRQMNPENAVSVIGEICTEAKRIEALKETHWRDEPMRRTACDLPVCGWRSICYARVPASATVNVIENARVM